MSTTLTSNILELINNRIAETNHQILEWLSLKYDTDRHTVKAILWRLVRQGKIQRVKRGVYRPTTELR